MTKDCRRPSPTGPIGGISPKDDDHTVHACLSFEDAHETFLYLQTEPWHTFEVVVSEVEQSEVGQEEDALGHDPFTGQRHTSTRSRLIMKSKPARNYQGMGMGMLDGIVHLPQDAHL